jgi:hypothetical protein
MRAKSSCLGLRAGSRPTSTHAAPKLAALYEQDKTAWLDTMAQLIRDGRHDELDFENLEEYLESMARRDSREVHSRLSVLLTQRLK